MDQLISMPRSGVRPTSTAHYGTVGLICASVMIVVDVVVRLTGHRDELIHDRFPPLKSIVGQKLRIGKLFGARAACRGSPIGLIGCASRTRIDGPDCREG